MCCEICPRYAACEDDGLTKRDMCCVSCTDYKSCYDKGGSKDGEASEEEF